MIREAELFVQADRALVGLVSRIRDDQWHLVLPPVFDMPGADVPVEVRAAVNHLAYDDAWVPAMLAGSTMDEVGRDTFDGDLLGDDPRGRAAHYGDAACAAARTAVDPAAPVHCSWGDCPTDDYLWQLNIARTLAAHDLAVLLGQPDPLTEELARGMYEGTAPAAGMWRSFGIYRAERPVPADASWRERFLALTGRGTLVA